MSETINFAAGSKTLEDFCRKYLNEVADCLKQQGFFPLSLEPSLSPVNMWRTTSSLWFFYLLSDPEFSENHFSLDLELCQRASGSVTAQFRVLLKGTELNDHRGVLYEVCDAIMPAELADKYNGPRASQLIGFLQDVLAQSPAAKVASHITERAAP